MTPSRPGDRLFVALWPDARVRGLLNRYCRGQSWPAGSRPVAAHNLHLTLAFLGTVPDATLPALHRALASVPLPGESAELVLDRPECWRKGLAVLCPSRIPDWLLHWHRQLTDRLEPLAIERDRLSFRPHVTLARHAGGTLPAPPLQPIVWPVRGMALVCSDPPGQYRVVHHYGPVEVS